MTRAGFSVGFITPRYWGKVLLNIVCSAPWVISSSSLAVGTGTFSGCVLCSIPTSHFRWFFPQPWIISSHAWAKQYCPENSRKTICRFQCCLWCGSFTSGIVLKAPAASFSLNSRLCHLNVESARLCLGFSPLAIAWNLLQVTKLA